MSDPSEDRFGPTARTPHRNPGLTEDFEAAVRREIEQLLKDFNVILSGPEPLFAWRDDSPEVPLRVLLLLAPGQDMSAIRPRKAYRPLLAGLHEYHIGLTLVFLDNRLGVKTITITTAEMMELGAFSTPALAKADDARQVLPSRSRWR